MVPAFNAYLPTQIEKDGLLKANSIVNISWQTAVLIGPIIAAQLLTVYDVENLFIFCLFFYPKESSASQLTIFYPQKSATQVPKPAGVQGASSPPSYATAREKNVERRWLF